MEILKNRLEILRAGESESLSILDDQMMEALIGGKVECNKKYSLDDDGTVHCGCDYAATPTDDPDEDKDNDSCCDCCGDKCDCNTDCPNGCNNCSTK